MYGIDVERLDGRQQHRRDDDDGGHAMLFKDKNGNLKISYHSPNTTGLERLTIKDVVIENNKVRIIE